MDDELQNSEEQETENDGKNGVSSDLIRGHINTIILRTLYERDKYGYEIIEEIEAKSHGQYTLKQPTLYSALKRLESQGYINAYWKTEEVSLGGRRKYYTLTDSGRQVIEKNLAEWEYSRTIIDNLISDKNFDFSQPAPSAVDFKILKNSTSRVPIVKDTEKSESENETSNVREVKIDDEIVVAKPAESEKPVQQVSEPAPAPAPVAIQPEQPKQTEIRNEEEDRKRHENYLKLISEPAVTSGESIAPSAESIDTEKLIYNKKPETERDYRNLVNGLFAKTVAPTPVSKRQPEQPVQYAPAPEPRYNEVNAETDNDGLTVNTAEYKAYGSRRKKYNLGNTLFKCSLIISVIMLFEFALTLIFKNELAVSIAYPFVIFAIACAQALIFGVLLLTGVGKNIKKPTSLNYLSTSIIITIIIIAIICVVSLLSNIDFSSAGQIAAHIIIPSLVALNIPLFAVFFYLLSKN